MARSQLKLEPCVDCGAHISPRMRRCPICGASRAKVAPRVWTLLAVLALLALAFGTSALDGIWAAN